MMSLHICCWSCSLCSFQHCSSALHWCCHLAPQSACRRGKSGEHESSFLSFKWNLIWEMEKRDFQVAQNWLFSMKIIPTISVFLHDHGEVIPAVRLINTELRQKSTYFWRKLHALKDRHWSQCRLHGSASEVFISLHKVSCVVFCFAPTLLAL